MKKRLNTFSDPEFQALPLSEKHTITNNFFNKLMADDEFYKLPEPEQEEIRSNFRDAQIDFSLSDTAEKVLDFVMPATPTPVDTTAPIDTTGDTIAPNLDGTMPEPAPKPKDTYTLSTGVQSSDETTTRPFVFDETLGKSLSPEQQDTATPDLFFGEGKEWENPDRQDWELGKAMVNTTNKGTKGMEKAMFRLLGSAAYTLINPFSHDTASNVYDSYIQSANKVADFVYNDNKFDVKQTHTPASIKEAVKASGIFDIDTVQETLLYGMDTTVTSLPEMAEIATIFPVYVLGKTENAAEQRARNDGRTEATNEDFMRVFPTELASAYLDRMGQTAVTTKVFDEVVKSAKDKGIKAMAKEVASKMKEGLIVESTTEGVQQVTEKLGQEIGTKHGLSSAGEYIEDASWAMLAGGMGGVGLSGLSSTGAEVFNAYTENKREQQRDAYIQDAYNKSLLGQGTMFEVDNTSRDNFERALDAKVQTVQRDFTNLVINNPDLQLPAEAADDVEMQERIVNAAVENGADISSKDGLNAIDEGYKALEEEIGMVDAPEPKAVEMATPDPVPVAPDIEKANQVQEEIVTEEPTIEKSVIGEPEPESKLDTERLRELEQTPEDELSIDDKFELEDLQQIQKKEDDTTTANEATFEHKLNPTLAESQAAAREAKNRKKKPLNQQAQAMSDIKESMDLSEDEQAEKIKQLKLRDPETNLKNLTKQQLNDYNAHDFFGKYSQYELDNAYKAIVTDKRTVKGKQVGVVVPKWAKNIISDTTTTYTDVMKAVADAKNGIYSELAGRALEAIRKDGYKHLNDAITKYKDYSERFWSDDLSEAEQEELQVLEDTILKDYITEEIDATPEQQAEAPSTNEETVQRIDEKGSTTQGSVKDVNAHNEVVIRVNGNKPNSAREVTDYISPDTKNGEDLVKSLDKRLNDIIKEEETQDEQSKRTTTNGDGLREPSDVQTRLPVGTSEQQQHESPTPVSDAAGSRGDESTQQRRGDTGVHSSTTTDRGSESRSSDEDTQSLPTDKSERRGEGRKPASTPRADSELGRDSSRRDEAGKELVYLVSNTPQQKSKLIGSAFGFDIYAENLGKGLSNNTTGLIIISGKQDYEIPFQLETQSYEGLTQKINNRIKGIAGEAQAHEENIKKTEKELPLFQEQIGTFKDAGTLDTLKLRKREVLAQLRKKEDDPKDVPDSASNMKLPSVKEVTKEAAKQLEPEAIKQSEATNHYARVHGYDEAGANYIPTYKVSGLPARPTDGTITIGSKRVVLPTLEAPMNADSLRVYVSDIIGTRLYEAKIKGKTTLGKYNRADSSIRVKSYSDMEIIAHEMAHYLDFFFNNKTHKATDSFFRREILKNRDEVKALSYTTKPKNVLSEGFAEFVRLWLTNYNTLNIVAPQMVKDFEAKLSKNAVLNKKMKSLQEGMHQYYYQGANVMLRSKRGGKLNLTAKRIKLSQAQIAKSMRQRAIDKMHSIKRIEAEINGDNAPDALDSAYKSLQLVNGASSIMYSAMNIGVPVVKANGDISYGGKPLNEILAPATKVSEDRVRLLEDYLVAKRADELMGQGREKLITRAEIDEGLKLADLYPEFETIFKEYQEFNDAMLDFYVAMKLITSAQKKTFQEFNKNYVPFHRVTESVQFGEVPPAKLGQRLTGGTHSINDIMENIINGIESNIKEAMIASGKSKFYDMLEKSGMGGVYATKVSTASKSVKTDINQQAKKIAQIMIELGIAVTKDGMILSGNINDDTVIDVKEIEENLKANPQTLQFWTHGHKPTSKSSYIDSVIINDKVVYFEVNDIDLVDAIISFQGSHHNAVMRGLMTIKNIMTWNITNNPLFYLTNFARDTVSAGVLSKNGFLPVISSVSGMYHFIARSKTYKEFMASGAGYATRRTTLGRDVSAMSMLKVNRGFAVLERLVSVMEYGADVFEYGTRIGDFSLAQRAGKSNMQSAYEGREVSTDFAIKGSNQTLSSAMATVPFMKAGINGIDKTAKRIFSLNGEMKFSNVLKFRNQLGELQAHKVKIYATGGIIAALTLALWVQNRDDERYKRLTKDKKLMYWHFWVGEHHIQIPRPYDIGFAFSAIPEIIADGVYTKHGEEAASHFLWGAKNMFSIGDVSGLFQPILDHMTNTKWTGAPVVPRSMQNMDDLGDQYYNSTPLVYRELGKKTGMSPILMQHYVDGYLGLTAKMVEEATENILWDKKQWGERPFAKNPIEFLTYRFHGRKEVSRTIYSEKYYELLQKANAVASSYDHKRKKAFIDHGKSLEIYVDDPKKKTYIKLSHVLKKYNKLLSKIKTDVEMTTYNPKLSRAEKEKKIDLDYESKKEMLKELTDKAETILKELEE